MARQTKAQKKQQEAAAGSEGGGGGGPVDPLVAALAACAPLKGCWGASRWVLGAQQGCLGGEAGTRWWLRLRPACP